MDIYYHTLEPTSIIFHIKKMTFVVKVMAIMTEIRIIALWNTSKMYKKIVPYERTENKPRMIWQWKTTNSNNWNSQRYSECV